MPNIKTFCRIKPTDETYEEHEATQDTLNLRVPETLKDFTNVYKGSRSYISHEFNFDHIFPQSASQADIFDVAASEIVNAFLGGYNGTIFAYGQTGTGKTYTMEGNAKTYDSRGIEPRALSMIYKELEKRGDEDLSIHLSYIEIYQDIGYDLLNPGLRLQSYVTPFPKVSVLEGYNGSCIVKNLSNHLAASEVVAQSLLLQGQANRKVAATAIHDRSSRSHAVFTIQLTSKKLDSDTIVRSKLHLVDLAGSERVAKTGVHGQQLTEAKSINLSLHHLETVIVALQQESLAREKSSRVKTSSGNRKYTPVPRPSSAEGARGPRHVPYRNSLLTMLLRDSLGGNCMTSMIATISLEISNLGESISTCRFAGRVACIANTVARNEQLDDKSLIKKLRKRIAELEAELACLRLSKEGGGDVGSMRLTEEDKIICAQVVKQYLSGKITDPISAGITNPNKFRECLKILKRVVSQNGYDNEGRRNSLSVVLPRHSPEPADEKDQIGELVNANDRFERRNHQKLKLDGQPDKRVSTADTNGRESKMTGSRPTTTSTLAWSDNQSQSRMSRASTNLPSNLVSRQTSASTHHTVATTSTMQNSASSTPAPEKIWFTSPNRKEPDTLSELLENDTIVKTPFQQKRINDIKKLNTRVEKMSAEKTEKEQQALDLKMQVAEKELDLMERHMQTKVGVTTAQVEDQHAYVKQLTSTEADHSLIEQEKLVEKQLRKRKEKYEKQLEYIEYKREQLKNQSGEGGMSAEKKASIQEKFGQFRKRDGSLNTRQVFQMLKQEERKQIKAQNNMDREKLQATADLMEIKELATRQKLRELKEAMKNNPNLGAPVIVQNGLEDKKSRGKGQENIVRTSKGENLNIGAQMNGVSYSMSRDGNLSASSMERAGTSDSLQGNESNYRTKDRDPKAKWESNYNRPTTPSNLKIPDTNVVSKTEESKDLKQSKDAENHEKSKENKTDSGRIVGKDGDKMVNGVNKTSQKLSNGLSEDIIESQSRKLEEELYKSKNNRFREKNRNLYDKSTGQNGPTQMPSEYVHGMSNPEQFDARRMGLSAKNFDSALTSMLGQENTEIAPKNEDYEQFARTSKYRPNPYIEAATQKITLTRSKSRASSRPPTRDTVNKPRSRESASVDRRSRENTRYDSGSPITTKVQQPTQPSPSPSKDRASRRSQQSRPASQGTADGYNMDEFLRNNSMTMFNASGSTLEIEEEEHHGRVKAMQEQEREQTFMNRAQIERGRVNRIRKARQSAEIIQRAWRKFKAKQKTMRR